MEHILIRFAVKISSCAGGIHIGFRLAIQIQIQFPRQMKRSISLVDGTDLKVKIWYINIFTNLSLFSYKIKVDINIKQVLFKMQPYCIAGNL